MGGHFFQANEHSKNEITELMIHCINYAIKLKIQEWMWKKIKSWWEDLKELEENVYLEGNKKPTITL